MSLQLARLCPAALKSTTDDPPSLAARVVASLKAAPGGHLPTARVRHLVGLEGPDRRKDWAALVHRRASPRYPPRCSTQHPSSYFVPSQRDAESPSRHSQARGRATRRARRCDRQEGQGRRSAAPASSIHVVLAPRRGAGTSELLRPAPDTATVPRGACGGRAGSARAAPVGRAATRRQTAQRAPLRAVGGGARPHASTRAARTHFDLSLLRVHGAVADPAVRRRLYSGLVSTGGRDRHFAGPAAQPHWQPSIKQLHRRHAQEAAPRARRAHGC